MDLQLKDKVAIVGGASKGLGRACAEVLAQEGVKVAICSRTKLIWKKLGRKFVTQAAQRFWSLPVIWIATKPFAT